MGEMIHELHTGGLMLVISGPDACTPEYTVRVGDRSDLESFEPRHAFAYDELPIVGRMLGMAYLWIFQHRRSS